MCAYRVNTFDLETYACQNIGKRIVSIGEAPSENKIMISLELRI
jgi:hypothetical protein